LFRVYLFYLSIKIKQKSLDCFSTVRKCKCCHSNDSNGEFLANYNTYFHQLVCLVVIPTLVVITCNSMVFYRIIQRRRMINSGKFLVTFKVNKNSLKQFDHPQAQPQSMPQQQMQHQQLPNPSSVPMIKVTMCGSTDAEITISNSQKVNFIR
jgi:hypothetical protein